MITKEEIYKLSNKGLLLYKILAPEIIAKSHSNTSNTVKSPITGKAASFSLTSFFDRYWRFTDKSANDLKGDVFDLLALLNDLDVRSDFPKVLQLALDMLIGAGILDKPSLDAEYKNTQTDEHLRLAPYLYSHLAEKQFQKNHPHFLKEIGYDMAVVKSFDRKIGRKHILHEHDWQKPNNTFFSIPVNDGAFYLLYNPVTGEYEEWGNRCGNDVVGWKQAMHIAFIKYPYASHTLIITNTLVGLLNLHSLSVPAIAFLNKGEEFPLYFKHVIQPKFSNIVLLYDETKENKDHIMRIAKQLGVEPTPLKYFEKGEWLTEPNHEFYFRQRMKEETSIDYVVELINHQLFDNLTECNNIVLKTH